MPIANLGIKIFKTLSLIAIFIVAFLLFTNILSDKEKVSAQDLKNSISLDKELSKDSLAPRTEAEQEIINAYKEVNKSVVNVSSLSQGREMLSLFEPNLVEGSGSGVIIDSENALVITNAHVIGNSNNVSVNLYDGQNYKTEIIGRDLDNDLALLKIINPPKELVAAEFADSSMLEVGQRVLAIGNPFGLNRTLTQGIISSLGRTIRAESGRLIEDIIQTDAAINPGNSGGPLLDTAGRIVGINTAIISKSGQSAGIGFVIPSNQIRQAIPQLIKYGRVLRPRIGIVLADSEIGPVVLYVKPGSPAEEAGIIGARRQVSNGFFTGFVTDLAGADFIVGVNDKKVFQKSEVTDMLDKLDPSKKVRLLLRKGSERKTREIKVIPELN